MPQTTQNFNNHKRIVPGFHFLTYGLIIALLIAGIVLLTSCGYLLIGSLTLLIAVTFAMTAIYTRSFAIKAQDRGIRVEENLRHFMLTGKPLSSGLRLGQIIALRFASDEEFVALAIRAEKENLKGKEIKQAIKNWRGDYHRV